MTSGETTPACLDCERLRADLARVTAERDALAKRWASAQDVYAAMLDELNALRKRVRELEA